MCDRNHLNCVIDETIIFFRLLNFIKNFDKYAFNKDYKDQLHPDLFID